MFEIVDDIECRVKEMQKKYNTLSTEFKALSDKHQQLNIEYQALKEKVENAYQRLTQLLTQLPEMAPTDNVPSHKAAVDVLIDTPDDSFLPHG